MVAAANLSTYNTAMMASIDTNRRTFRGRPEVRMLLTAAEIAYLCDIQPVQAIRETIHHRGTDGLRRLESIDLVDSGWPRAKVYVPDEVPFMVPLKNGRTMALPAIDALYALHQSDTLLDKYWMPLVTDDGELLLTRPAAMPADIGWYKQLLGLPYEPTIPDVTAAAAADQTEANTGAAVAEPVEDNAGAQPGDDVPQARKPSRRAKPAQGVDQ